MRLFLLTRGLFTLSVTVLALMLVASPVAEATAPPATPGAFQATVSNSSSAVSLTWTASSAPYGIKGYLIERSLDQVTWQSVISGLQGTTYSDTTVAFGVHYYYRISAIDPSGQASGYAFADVMTNAFNANITVGSGGSQFNSTDGIASVTIPTNAMPNSAVCNVEKIGLSPGSSPGAPSHHLVAGPYELLCKTSDGTSVLTFAEPIEWQYNLKGLLKNAINPQPYKYVGNGNNPLVSGALYSTAKQTLSFADTDDNPTMILGGTAQAGILSLDLVFVFLVIGALLVGIGMLAASREQKKASADYIRHKYYDA